jgi:hypothetical protein
LNESAQSFSAACFSDGNTVTPCETQGGVKFMATTKDDKLAVPGALGAPIAAILIPAAFFFSVVSPTAKEPNALINLAYVGAAFLAAAVLTLGIGLFT